MPAYLAPALYALLLWWFATGFILFLNSRAPSSFRRSFAGATALGVIAAWSLISTVGDTSTAGAYRSFSCAVVLWGWLEAGFLMGFISGPRRTACREGCGGRRHLLHAIQAVIYNDAATALLVGAIYLASLKAPNRLGLWTLMILWVMRISAKLNLFLGVENLGETLLPPHLQYLRSFFRRRPMNWLFPLSITGATGAIVALVTRMLAANDPFRLTSLALASSLLLLGLVEHWFMVLPLPSDRLWSWVLHLGGRPRRGRQTPRTMLLSETASNSQSPPHSVRSTSAN